MAQELRRSKQCYDTPMVENEKVAPEGLRPKSLEQQRLEMEVPRRQRHDFAKSKKASRLNLEKISVNATHWIGSIKSLVVHTTLFLGVLSLSFFGFNFDRILLVLTTLLSFEAIYLAIFIQMTVNRNTVQLYEVEKDIEEIQEDVEGISEDIEGIQEDVEEIQEDVEEISEEDGNNDKKKILSPIS